MAINRELWEKLADAEYRKYFVEELAKRAFATQVRTIRKKREWSQERLAKESEITQGVVSRTENPSVGTTFDTAAQIAAGFGLAFIPKIVPYSEFVKWAEEVSEGYTDLPTFEEENADIERAVQEQEAREDALVAALGAPIGQNVYSPNVIAQDMPQLEPPANVYDIERAKAKHDLDTLSAALTSGGRKNENRISNAGQSDWIYRNSRFEPAGARIPPSPSSAAS